MVGGNEADVLRGGFERFVHPDDRVLVNAATEHAEPHELLFRIVDKFGELRHLEAYVTDLRGDGQNVREAEAMKLRRVRFEFRCVNLVRGDEDYLARRAQE